MTARYTVKFPSEPFQLHGPDCPGLQLCRVSAPPSRRDNIQSGLYCSVQNKKLKLKFFSSRPLPCHSSPLSLFSFFLLIDLTQRLSGKAWRQATDILAQLCLVPGDSQHYRSLGVDASFFTIPGYSHCPSHSICSSSVFLFP